MSSRFDADYDGIGEMLCSPGMQAEMRERAEKGKAFAEAVAPVGPSDDPHRGRYKASFSVSSGVQRNLTARAYGELTNDSPEAVFVEYGTKNNDRHRVLGRALDVMGE